MNDIDILQSLNDSLRAHGYVGDTRPAKLVYLALVSTLLPKPVSLVIKGPPGSGKSFALRCGKRYVPADAYEEFHGMSEKALVYMGDELDLKHRGLIIQEAAGLRDGPGRAFIRQLLTEGEIRYATVQSNKDGLKGVELPPVEGPCGLLMTTTANQLHPEDESRMLSYHIDESPERVREALIAAASGKVTEPTEAELEDWHELYWDAQEEVTENGTTVVLPFGPAIAEKMPLSHYRTIRDLEKVISLIQTHALLRYCAGDRELDAEGRVIATLEDYAAVRELVEGILAHGLEVAVPDSVREVVEAVTALASTTDSNGDTMPWDEFQGVSQRRLADLLGRDISVISRNVRKAIEDGYLEDENAGQGRASRLFPGERRLPSGHVLPLPEELEDVERPRNDDAVTDSGDDRSGAMGFEDMVLTADEEDEEGPTPF